MAVKILSIIFAVLAIIICLYSLWLMEAHHEGYMANSFGLFYGSWGLLITSLLALAGIITSGIWRRRNKATSELPHKLYPLFILVICILLFLFALSWVVLRGDIS